MTAQLATSLAKLGQGLSGLQMMELRGQVHSVRGMELAVVGLGRLARMGGQVLVAGRVRGEIVFVSEVEARVGTLRQLGGNRRRG